MRPRGLVLVALIAFSSVLAAGQVPFPRETPPPRAPQEPIATFRAGVRAIQIDAVVTDDDGNPVRGLTIDDFEISERGRPQPITTFEAVDIPIESQPPDLADSDVVTNTADGRIYLIVIDSISAENGQNAKRELRKFFANHFAPGDVAAVMLLYRGHFSAGWDFTSNRRRLIEGIDSFVGYSGREERVEPGSASPLSALQGSVTRAIVPGPNTPLMIAQREMTVVGARNRMARLKELTEFLLKIPGRRKAMVLVSEAIGFDAIDFKDYQGSIMNLAAEDAHAAMTLATRGNIAIYPIHPGGAADADGPTGIEKLESTMELRSIAAATGGFALVNSNNFEGAFTRLVQEQSVYYMLGFNAGEDRDDGRYVPVKVTLKRPGLKVLARDGYLAPFKGRDTARLVERRPGVELALSSPIRVAGVPLKAFAAPFKGKGKTASILVALEMDSTGLGLAELPDGGRRGAVEVRMVATDIRSKVLPQVRQTGNIAISAGTRADIERGGLGILTKTELQPGRYQLRIAIGTAQRGGSVVYDLEVPDYSKKDLAISGLVLRGPDDADGVFLPSSDPLRTLSTSAPTISRTFENSDKVSVYAEVYDNTGAKPHSIELKSEIRSESGEVTPVVTVSRSSDDLKGTGGTLRLDAPLPLAKLAAGRYVLSVDVRSSAGGDPLTRSVPFRVR
jgi:VWFA-related protein